MDMPDLEQWDFPNWLIGVCEVSDRFDEARRILIEKYGFVEAILEKIEDPSVGSVVLPIPDLDLEQYFKNKESHELFKGWGIGRARFNKFSPKDSRLYRGGPNFEFKYFIEDCPWKYMKSNPMKEATIEVISILEPLKFINYRGEEIPNPYK